VLLLLGGGGVLAYTMLVADDNDGSTPEQNSAGIEPGATPAKPDVPPEKAHTAPIHTPPQHMQVVPPPVVHVQPPTHVVAAADDNSPKGLLAQSATAEAARDWASVRSVNEKLEKFPKFAPEAVYEQAWAAFQMNDTPKALSLSTRAAKLMGAHNMKALVLYADTIFKQGDVKRAKDNYLVLRRTADKDLKSVITKKIALCNQTLGLPERDGILKSD
jgi:hypothetical protein